MDQSEVSSRVLGDSGFVDTDADLDFIPKLPPILQDPGQAYATIKLNPHLEGDDEEDDLLDEEEVRRSTSPLLPLTSLLTPYRRRPRI